MSGVNWAEQARKWAEGGGDPSALFDMPLGRAFVLLVAPPRSATRIESASDLRAWRNRIRAKKGLPLVPDPKPAKR